MANRRSRSRRRGRRIGLLDYFQNLMDDTYDFVDDSLDRVRDDDEDLEDDVADLKEAVLALNTKLDQLIAQQTTKNVDVRQATPATTKTPA